MNGSNDFTIIEKIAISVAILLCLAGIVLTVFFRTPLGGLFCNISLVIFLISNSIRLYINMKSKNRNDQA